MEMFANIFAISFLWLALWTPFFLMLRMHKGDSE